jgi:hypothetical protein
MAATRGCRWVSALDIVAPSQPLVCRNGKCNYAAIPLGPKLAIPPSDVVLRVGAANEADTPRPPTVPSQPKEVNGTKRVKPFESKPSLSASSPIDEASAIQTDLRNLLGRVRGLSALIRRQRQQHRLVKQTLASLKELHRVGA